MFADLRMPAVSESKSTDILSAPADELTNVDSINAESASGMLPMNSASLRNMNGNESTHEKTEDEEDASDDGSTDEVPNKIEDDQADVDAAGIKKMNDANVDAGAATSWKAKVHKGELQTNNSADKFNEC